MRLSLPGESPSSISMASPVSAPRRPRAAFRFALTLATALLSCGPPAPPIEVLPEPVLDRRNLLAPELLTADVFKNYCDVTWKTNRLRGDVIRGYNVYVSPVAGLSELSAASPGLQEKLYLASTYPGDTDGDISIETIRIEGVESGKRFYVHVRTVRPDGGLGPPSCELEIIPRPRGRFTLCPRFSGCSDGFSFRLDSAVTDVSDENDLYLFVTKSEFMLASPSRMDRNLRATRFADLGPSQSLSDHPDFDLKLPMDEKIPIHEGRSIGLLLQGNRIAKLRPVEIQRSVQTLRVVFEYMYQPLADVSSF